METNYKKYIDEVLYLRKKTINYKKGFIKKVVDDIESEFSKYFTKTPIKDLGIDISNKGQYSNNAYLLNDEYGIVLNISEYDWEIFTPNFKIHIQITYKNYKLNKFILSSYIHTFTAEHDDASEIAKRLYDELKVKYDKRTKNKEKREFKNQTNKYNL